MTPRTIALVVLGTLAVAWLVGLVAVLVGTPTAGRFVYGAIAVAAVAIAVLAVLWVWPRLTGPSDQRSPQLVRCPRCASTFTPELRASRATCPTCGLVAQFRSDQGTVQAHDDAVLQQ